MISLPDHMATYQPPSCPCYMAIDKALVPTNQMCSEEVRFGGRHGFAKAVARSLRMFRGDSQCKESVRTKYRGSMVKFAASNMQEARENQCGSGMLQQREQ